MGKIHRSPLFLHFSEQAFATVDLQVRAVVVMP